MNIEENYKKRLVEQVDKGKFCFCALQAFMLQNDYSNSIDAVTQIERILKEFKEKITT